LLILFVSNESYIHGLCQEVDLLFTYMSFCCDLETVQEISLMGFTSLSVLACSRDSCPQHWDRERHTRTADRERTGIQIGCCV